MIRICISGIIAGTILFMSCSKDNEAEPDVTYECKILYATDDTLRSTSKTLKGHILFSWKNNINSWNYSIVPNLNINPAHENVCTSNSFSADECLKKNLLIFAEGEQFYWDGNHSIETIEGKKIKLSYPPDNIIKDIQAFCDSINIELILQ